MNCWITPSALPLKSLGVPTNFTLPLYSMTMRSAMLYKGKVKLVGTPGDFRSSSDGVIQQFINGRAEGPMEA